MTVALGRRVPAGVLDAALSSLASLAVGIVAVRSLGPETLGGYAFVFTAFLLAALVPALLVFTPLEIRAVSLPEGARLGTLRSSLRWGLPGGALAALGVTAWLPFATRIPPADVVALTSTAAVAASLSPLQDHIRRLLHFAAASWSAAAISAVHLVAAVGTIALLLHTGVSRAWIPFGALAAGNLVSLLAGLGLSHQGLRVAPTHSAPGLLDLVRPGRWLLLAEIVPGGAAFATSAIVTQLGGPALLGYAEAARVAGQPVLVLAAGMAVVFAPRSIIAARSGHLTAARQVSRLFGALVTTAGLAYLAWVSMDWWGNPVIGLLPRAYVFAALPAVTILANIIVGVATPLRTELVGGGRGPTLVVIECAGNAARIVVAGFTGLLGAFAVPGGLLALGLVRWAGAHRALRTHYNAAPSANAAEPPTSAGVLP
jgi:hypothetical protein